MARILVTGATGFIGRHVVTRLLSKGHEVITTGLRESIEECPWLRGVTYISRDLSLPCNNFLKWSFAILIITLFTIFFIYLLKLFL